MRIAAIVVAFMFVLPSPSSAGAPAYSDADVQQLVQAVLAIPVDHQFLLALETQPASDMPPWDHLAHYAGPVKIPDGRTAYAVVVDDQYASALTDLGHADHAVGAAVTAAVFLAVIDAGRAGPKWKSWYDKAAAADAALPGSVADRYTNRHALVAALADSKTALYASIAGPDTASYDEFGLPLSDPIDYGTGLVEYARLGVASARLIELYEFPGALKQHATQSFIDAWFAKLGPLLPDDASRAHLTTLRPLFAVASIDDLKTHQQRFAGGMLSVVNSLDKIQVEAFGIGYDANDLRYNALGIKSTKEDDELRSLVGGSDALDSAVPGLTDLRARLASLGPADWSTVADLSGQIVKLLVPNKHSN
ncbi:MAG TPA: hypothetical protein VFO25_11240 [Candidatus Eremiobacteraceae bacterium]|nr:hypothetical protein [Candidatus Eremiobacteraceae bacterium]